MRKKKNLLKRNSGFIVGCVLAAGASFFTADMLMSDRISLVTPETGITEEPSEAVLEPEKAVSKTYETDSFTVTASGNIIKGIEEVPETEPQTNEDGEVIAAEDTDADGNVISSGDGSSENGSGDSQSSDGSWSDGSSSDGQSSDGSWSDGSSGDGQSGDSSWSDGSSWGSGSSDGSWDGSYDQSIEIQDPGNGDYSYSDGSGSSGSGSSGDSAWTPDDVILWGISSRYIDVSELYQYGSATIRKIRNEIFALHGRIFRDPELANYFSQKSWYVPTYDPDDFDANMFDYLNDYEEANLQLILDYEAWLAEN